MMKYRTTVLHIVQLLRTYFNTRIIPFSKSTGSLTLSPEAFNALHQTLRAEPQLWRFVLERLR
jgi:hypothetical protein